MKPFPPDVSMAVSPAVPPSSSEQGRHLLDAIRRGDSEAARQLLETDPSLANARGTDGVAAARLAMYYRHAPIAKLLIDFGAQLDIHDAAATGELKRLQYLTEIDPSQVNSYSIDGATPLGLAAFFGHRDAVEFLLDHSAGIDKPAKNPAFPFVPLHSAMSAGHNDIVELLLSRGADVTVREGGGMTVLHEAAGLGNLGYVQLLLQMGADPMARTDAGKLAEDFALHGEHWAVVEVLSRLRK